MKILPPILIITLLLLIHVIAYSQASFEASVRLVDGSLPSGNALILNKVDSTFVNGDFFIDGQIQLEDLPDSSLLLKLTSIEFRDTIIDISFSLNSNIEPLIIYVESFYKTFDEVMISARRPTFVVSSDGSIEVQIAGTTLAASSSTQEIISKSPEIIVDENGGIGVLGRGAASIFLNNQKITVDQLGLIMPSQIKSIQIFRNPPARYDAEGGAVIVIYTLNKAIYESRFSIQQNIEYSSFSGFKSFSNIDYEKSIGKLLFTAQVGLDRGEDKFIKGTTRRRSPENIEIFSDLYTEWNPYQDYSLQYGIGTQYATSNSGYLSLKYNCRQGLTTGSTNSTNTILTANSKGDFAVDITRDERRSTHSIDLNYNQPLGLNGSNIFIGGQFYRLSDDYYNPIVEKSDIDNVISSRSLRNSVNRAITISSAQIDYRYEESEKYNFDLGAKIGIVNNGEFADFLIQKDLTFSKDDDLSNDFIYDENILSAYGALSYNLSEKFNFRSGLRAEYTRYNIEVDALTRDLTDNYISLFPSLAIEYRYSEDYQFGISYSESINRQDYNQLNPSLIYQDPYTSIQGNPFLLPERFKALELSARLKGTNMKLGYSYTQNPFSGAAVPGSDSLSYILIRINNTFQNAYYLNLSRSFSYKGLSSNISISQFYNKQDENEVGLKADDPISQFYLYTTHRLKLGRGWFVEALAYYYTAYQDGTVNRKPAGNLTLSIDKKFFNNALTIRLVANDVLHSQRADGDYTAGVTDITFRNKWDSNYFRLAVSYNFNKNRKSNFKSKSVSAGAVNRVR